MPPDPLHCHWLDRPHHLRWLWRGFLLLLAAAVGAELVVALHPHFEVEQVFGFNAWYGFGACAAMIALAKALAWVLKRPDRYYDEGGSDG